MTKLRAAARANGGKREEFNADQLEMPG